MDKKEKLKMALHFGSWLLDPRDVIHIRRKKPKRENPVDEEGLKRVNIARAIRAYEAICLRYEEIRKEVQDKCARIDWSLDVVTIEHLRLSDEQKQSLTYLFNTYLYTIGGFEHIQAIELSNGRIITARGDILEPEIEADKTEHFKCSMLRASWVIQQRQKVQWELKSIPVHPIIITISPRERMPKHRSENRQ